MDLESIKYIAFYCFKGLFEFFVMPFRLTNSCATFQRLMDTIFGDRYFQDILGYFDNLLIYNCIVETTVESFCVCLK